MDSYFTGFPLFLGNDRVHSVLGYQKAQTRWVFPFTYYLEWSIAVANLLCIAKMSDIRHVCVYLVWSNIYCVIIYAYYYNIIYSCCTCMCISVLLWRYM